MTLYYFSYCLSIFVMFFIMRTHFISFSHMSNFFLFFIILVRDYKVVLSYTFIKCLLNYFLYIVQIIQFLLLWLGLILKTLIVLYFVCIECTCIFNKISLLSFSVLLVAVSLIILPPILFHLLYQVIYYFIF